MIRIWNYNKSRIHSFRGAKEILIKLDKQMVFAGEIMKATGTLTLKPGSNEQIFETILLTEDERLLNKIASSDWINSKESEDIVSASFIRPSTTSKS
jgi:hypothetical protein